MRLQSLWISLVLLLMAGVVYAQQPGRNFKIMHDPESGEPLYRGQITFTDLARMNVFELEKKAQQYRPDISVMKPLKPLLDSCQVVVFLGTWCADSRQLVPQLYQVLRDLHYPFQTIPIYALDRHKASGIGKETEYKVQLVPSIILYKEGREVGRITESIQSKNIETDLLNILRHPLH